MTSPASNGYMEVITDRQMKKREEPDNTNTNNTTTNSEVLLGAIIHRPYG